MIWLVFGAAAWLVAVVVTCALLAAAKRGDAALERERLVTGWALIAHAARPFVAGLLAAGADSVIVVLREARRAGQVVVVMAGGDAAELVGRALPPDDFVAAWVAMSGQCEPGAQAAAVPLWRDGDAIGAIGISVRTDRAPLSRGQLERLRCVGDALMTQLSGDASLPLSA